MTAFNVIFRTDEPSAFAVWEMLPEFARGQEHPITSVAGERYYAATHSTAVDLSFAIVDFGAPQLLVKCNVFGKALGYFSEPIILLSREGLTREIYAEMVHAALKVLVAIASKNGAAVVAVKEKRSSDDLTILARECVAWGGKVELWKTGLCDLSLSEKEIHGRIRKSFKSLVNWGRRNLTMKYFSAMNADSALFESYRNFHTEVAGRITRSDKSWNSMRDWILGGTGELALAYLESEELVAGTMSVDGTETSLYASGVYDRTRFEMPLSHFALYNAILRARDRGLRWFDLGHLPEKGSVSDKEYNIGFFKRGFATDVGVYDVWKYDVTEKAGART